MSDQSPKLPFEQDDQKEPRKDDREQTALLKIQRFMDASRRYREPYLIRAEKAYADYRNYAQEIREGTGRANLQLPIAYTAVQELIPHLLNPVLKKRPYIQVRPRGPEDEIWAALLSEHLDYQLEQMKFASKYTGFLTDFLVAGTAVAKIPYRFDQKWITKTIESEETVTDPATGEPMIHPETGEPVVIPIRSKEDGLETVFDGPDFEPVRLFDFYPDWAVYSAGDIQSMRGCVHRLYKTYDELKTKERRILDGEEMGVYRNLDKLKLRLLVRGNDAWAPVIDPESFNRMEDRQLNREEGIKALGKIEVWEYWGLFTPAPGQTPREFIITIANGDTVIRLEESPIDMKFKPFIAVPNIVIPGEFYGDGDIEPIKSLIREAKALRDARLTNVNLTLNKMKLISRTAGINPRTLTVRPGGAVYGDDISSNGIRELPTSDVPGSSFAEYQQIEREIQGAIGIVNVAQPTGNLPRGLGRTATGVNYMQERTDSRVGIKKQNLDEMLFKRMGWMMLQYNKQFASNEIIVRVHDPHSNPQLPGNPYGVLPPDAFMRPYDFTINSGMDLEDNMQKLWAFAELAHTANQTEPGRVNLGALIDAMGKELLGNQRLRFIRTDEEMLQLQQQQLASQQAVNADIGRNTPQGGQGGGMPI